MRNYFSGLFKKRGSPDSAYNNDINPFEPTNELKSYLSMPNAKEFNFGVPVTPAKIPDVVSVDLEKSSEPIKKKNTPSYALDVPEVKILNQSGIPYKPITNRDLGRSDTGRDQPEESYTEASDGKFGKYKIFSGIKSLINTYRKKDANLTYEEQLQNNIQRTAKRANIYAKLANFFYHPRMKWLAIPFSTYGALPKVPLVPNIHGAPLGIVDNIVGGVTYPVGLLTYTGNFIASLLKFNINDIARAAADLGTGAVGRIREAPIEAIIAGLALYGLYKFDLVRPFVMKRMGKRAERKINKLGAELKRVQGQR